MLVVGAGPTGLALTAGLARARAAVRVVDAAPGPVCESRAFGVGARTLEVLDDLGVAEEAVRRGRVLTHGTVHLAGRVVARLDLRVPGAPFPFLLGLPQSDTEEILTRLVADLRAPVQRPLRLTGLEQDGAGVSATLARPDGTAETWRAGWVVGCDGAHSAVRRALGVPFEGHDIAGEFGLADVRAGWDLAADGPHVFLHPQGILALFPLPRAGRWRIIADLTTTPELPDVLDLDVFARLLRERTPLSSGPSDPGWITRFTPRERRVSRYRTGRVLLAGDAAHTHSPVGAQGMNTGVQDAANLAWKLALVASGDAAAALLDTYAEERAPVARRVLSVTRLATRLVTVRRPAARAALGGTIAVGSRLPRAQRTAAAALNQRWVRYRGSSLTTGSRAASLHPRGGPRPGDLAPDAPLRLEGRPTTLRHVTRTPPVHHLLLFEGRDAASGPDGLAQLAAEAETAAPGLVRVVRISLRPEAALHDPGGVCHRRYGAAQPCLVLVRPDRHVALRVAPPELAPLLHHLRTRVLRRP